MDLLEVPEVLTLGFGSSWIQYLHHFNGHYPYPMLDLLGPIQRAMVYGGASLLFCLSLNVVNGLHRLLHPTLWKLSSQASHKAE